MSVEFKRHIVSHHYRVQQAVRCTDGTVGYVTQTRTTDLLMAVETLKRQPKGSFIDEHVETVIAIQRGGK